MIDPRSISAGSIMPPFPALATDDVDSTRTAAKMRALRSVGVPYTPTDIDGATSDQAAQATEIAASLHTDGVGEAKASSELVALIAYLQRLGVHPQPQPSGPAVSMAR